MMVNTIRYTKARWNAFKAAIRSIRINWKVGVAILATVIITAVTYVIYNCNKKIKVR